MAALSKSSTTSSVTGCCVYRRMLRLDNITCIRSIFLASFLFLSLAWTYHCQLTPTVLARQYFDATENYSCSNKRLTQLQLSLEAKVVTTEDNVAHYLQRYVIGINTKSANDPQKDHRHVSGPGHCLRLSLIHI